MLFSIFSYTYTSDILDTAVECSRTILDVLHKLSHDWVGETM